jgi:hypothetical protein
MCSSAGPTRPLIAGRVERLAYGVVVRLGGQIVDPDDVTGERIHTEETVTLVDVGHVINSWLDG